MSYAIEIVDDQGEDHRPSSDERLVATICVCVNQERYQMKCAVAHQKLKERRG